MLLARGWICASLDLPSHGAQVEPGEPVGIAGWRWRFDRGQVSPLALRYRARRIPPTYTLKALWAAHK